MNIFVGNIPYAMEEDELKDIFAAFGSISSVKIVMDRETGRSRGFGFVDMGNDEEAKNAMNRLNGSEYYGKQLTVKEALDKNSPDRRFNRRP